VGNVHKNINAIGIRERREDTRKSTDSAETESMLIFSNSILGTPCELKPCEFILPV
jgi:hypothetical protein